MPLSPLSPHLIRRALTLATATRIPDDIDTPRLRIVLVANYRGHMFPAIHGTGPVVCHVVTRTMSQIREKLGIDDASAHDLRRTGANLTASERCGVRGEVIVRILIPYPTRFAGQPDL